MHIEDLVEIQEQKEIAEAIHELKKEGEQFLFWDSERRLIVAREIPQIMKNKKTGYEKVMTHVSKVLEIKDRKSYEEMDVRYNLTMY